MENIIQDSSRTSTGSETQEIVINFINNSKFNLPEDSKLGDLKDLINKEYMMRSDEYEIFIKDMQLLIINQELKISTLIQTYQTNSFVIRSFKNVFDLKQQLIEYNDFLDHQISKSENHLNELNDDFINFKKEIEN